MQHTGQRIRAHNTAFDCERCAGLECYHSGETWKKASMEQVRMVKLSDDDMNSNESEFVSMAPFKAK